MQELQIGDSDGPTLLIFDNLLSLPPENSCLYKLMGRSSTHIIILLSNYSALDILKKSIDNKLMRGINVMELEPLSELHCTQRLVHGIMSQCDFVPYNREQEILADIAEKTLGSPDLVEAASALLSKLIAAQDDEGDRNGFLECFYSKVCCCSDESSYDFATRLVKAFSLSECDFFFLSTLSLFGTAPIPRRLVEAIQLLSLTASSELPSGLGPLAHLISSHLLTISPTTIILSPSHPLSSHALTKCRDSYAGTESEFYSVPKVIADAARSCMDEKDLVFSFAVAHRALSKLHEECTGQGVHRALGPFMAGMAKILADSLEECNGMEDCYKEVYRTYLRYAITDHHKSP